MTNIDRKNPLIVTIKERYALNRGSSAKETFHISLDLKDKNISFQVGDSIGVLAQNDPILVDHLLHLLKATGDELITYERTQEVMSLKTFLSHKANLARISSAFLKFFYEHTFSAKKEQLHFLLQGENRPALQQYLTSHDSLDLLKEFATKQVPLQELCNQFAPLLPRFYSIASSPISQPDQIDLVVAISTFTHSGEKRYGVASHFLCHLAEIGKTAVPIYVQPAHGFRLPENPLIDIIMVGPGTGVAPFRGFIQERVHLAAKGAHWLFFGERHQESDFYYRDFFSQLVQQNQLKLDLAFSRDQEHKVYVQHKMLENATELWQWLEKGAHFYVCGDAEKMAKDVDAALHQIAQQEGKLSAEAAKLYVKNLRASKRYQTDVY